MHKKNIPINAIKIGILLFTVLIGTFTIVMCWKNINTRSANNKIKLNTIEESIKTKIEIYDFALAEVLTKYWICTTIKSRIIKTFLRQNDKS